MARWKDGAWKELSNEPKHDLVCISHGRENCIWSWVIINLKNNLKFTFPTVLKEFKMEEIERISNSFIVSWIKNWILPALGIDPWSLPLQTREVAFTPETDWSTIGYDNSYNRHLLCLYYLGWWNKERRIRNSLLLISYSKFVPLLSFIFAWKTGKVTMI